MPSTYFVSRTHSPRECWLITTYVVVRLVKQAARREVSWQRKDAAISGTSVAADDAMEQDRVKLQKANQERSVEGLCEQERQAERLLVCAKIVAAEWHAGGREAAAEAPADE